MEKKFRCMLSYFLIISLTASFLTIFPKIHVFAAASCWTDNWRVQVFKDALQPEGASTSISMVVAKNEYEPAQILIRNTDSFTIEGVTFTDLTSGSNTIESDNLSYNFVSWFHSDQNTPGLTNNNIVRSAPEDYPEYLINESTITVPGEQTQPIWITLFVPSTTEAGTYTGTVNVNTTIGNISVPMSVEVNNVTLPDPAEGTFSFEFWTQLYKRWGRGAHSYDERDVINNMYDFPSGSDEYWELLPKFASFMQKNRFNALLVPMYDLLIDGGTTLDDNGTYTFNFSLFDRFIQVFIDADAVKWLVGEHLIDRLGGAWESLSTVTYFAKDIDGTLYKEYDSVGYGDDGQNFLNQFLPALKSHLEEKGWADKWRFHMLDEAGTDDHKSIYKTISAIVKSYWTNAIISDAGRRIDDFIGSINGWIPQLGDYEGNKAAFNDRKTSFDEDVWMYTCGAPQGDYLNRFIDQQLYKMELIGWYCNIHRLDGYLHWGLNQWTVWSDSNNLGNDTANNTNLGDCFSIYPDTTRNDITSSIRIDSAREAAEDYELFEIIRKSKPSYAEKLAGTLVSSATSCSTDINEIIERRNDLVRAAAGIYNTDINDLPTILNDDHRAIKYTGNWQSFSPYIGCYNNDTHESNTAGSTAQFTFIGTQAEIYCLKDAWTGSFNVQIDYGAPITVDTRVYEQPFEQCMQLVFDTGELTDESHTVTITLTGDGWIELDYISVSGEVSCDTSMPIIVNDDHPAITYTGNWQKSHYPGCYNDDTHKNNTAGDTAQFTFTGTRAAIYCVKFNWMGSFNVQVDDGDQTLVNTYSDTEQHMQPVFDTGELQYGNHTVTITLAGESGWCDWIELDYVTVLGEVSYNAPTPTPILTTWASDNLATGKPATFSENLDDGDAYTLTDGDLNADNYAGINKGGPQWLQIDLGVSRIINGAKLWQYYKDKRTYNDVIVQLSDTEDFSDATTVFNNDTNNTSNMEYGRDAKFTASSFGKDIVFDPVKARYIRIWSNGNTVNDATHFVEVQVYPTTRFLIDNAYNESALPQGWSKEEFKEAVFQQLVDPELMWGYENDASKLDLAMTAVNMYFRLTGDVEHIELSEEAPYVDCENDSRYAEMAVKYNFLTEDDDYFKPQIPVTRSYVVDTFCKVLNRAGFEIDEDAEFTEDYEDIGDLTGQSRSNMAYFESKGLIDKIEEGELEPLGYATREQIVVIAKRVAKLLGPILPPPDETPTQDLNLALNKTATASSQEHTALNAGMAIDGDTSTRWASNEGADPQWIYVDLGESYDINRVKLNWEDAYGKSYKIQVSDDTIAWTDIYSTTTGNGGIDDLIGLSGTGRYVRMYGTERGTDYGYSLWEFEVYGSDDIPLILQVDFKDINGNIVDKLNNSQHINADLRLKNSDSVESRDVLVIVALYDAQNVMKNISFASRTIAPDEVIELGGGFNLPADVSGHYIEVFVWNNWEQMNPISSVICIPQK